MKLWRSIMKYTNPPTNKHTYTHLHSGKCNMIRQSMKNTHFVMARSLKHCIYFYTIIHALKIRGMMTLSNGNIFRALPAPCEGKSPVTGEFPSQRAVTRSFDIFFDLRLNKHLSKQSSDWWFETPSPSLWRHCYGILNKHGSCDCFLYFILTQVGTY